MRDYYDSTLWAYIYLHHLCENLSVKILLFFVLIKQLPPRSTLFPYTTLFRSSVKRPDGGNIFAQWNPKTRQRELRSEEHTSELQSRRDLVCRLLLEKKKT